MNKIVNPITHERIAPHSMVKKLIFPGDELFLFCNSFYVKSKVNEVQYIFARPNSSEPAIWFSIYSPGVIKVGHEVKIVEKNFEYEAEKDCWPDEDMYIVNIFPWCEFPTGGHSAYIDDDSFFTLEDARKRWGRFSKKGKNRRARQYLHGLDRWLAKQHGVKKVFSKDLEKIKVYY